MKKKYKILRDKNTSIVINGSKLYRIQALINFHDVKEGDIGGYIESDKNLSHDGDCWVYDDSKVYDNATVTDNAIVKYSSVVTDNAYVTSKSIISNNSIISGNAKIFDNCNIDNKSHISGNSIIKSNVTIKNSTVKDNVIIDGFFNINSGVTVAGNVFIHGDGIIMGDNTTIETSSYYRDNLEIRGNYIIIGPASKIKNIGDIYIIGMYNNLNVSHDSNIYKKINKMRSITITKNIKNQYHVCVNISDEEFFGNIYEFRDFINNHKSLDNETRKDYIEQINIFIDTIENNSDIIIQEE
jgi:bacterial transferase hexapeptide repeat protein